MSPWELLLWQALCFQVHFKLLGNEMPAQNTLEKNPFSNLGVLSPYPGVMGLTTVYHLIIPLLSNLLENVFSSH